MMPLILLALIAAIIIVVFEMHEALLVPYRKGCEECATAKRRAIREAEELEHDTAHKGFGWKAGAKDIYECGDDACKRNPPRVD